MIDLVVDPRVWISLFSVTLVQIALGSDNLIIITIIANKLTTAERKKAINFGLLLAMVFRIFFLLIVSYILKYFTGVFYQLDSHHPAWVRLHAELSGKSVLLFFGGLFLVWKGVKELRLKSKGLGQEVQKADRFSQVVLLIVSMNLLFSVDSILTVVGMTDVFPVMAGSVIISVGLMLFFAGYISDYMTRNPDFEILGLFVLLLIGFVLFLEGGHVAHLIVNGNLFPYIPQWIVIFILLLMFSVDLWQNWPERKGEKDPILLHRRKKASVVEG
jgi:predicted tellurium resistance membrane protein TerC